MADIQTTPAPAPAAPAPAPAPKPRSILGDVESFFVKIEHAIEGNPQGQQTLSQAKTAATSLENSVIQLADPAADAILDAGLAMIPGGSWLSGIGNAVLNALIAKATAQLQANWSAGAG